jgi:hypothetical protein
MSAPSAVYLIKEVSRGVNDKEIRDKYRSRSVVRWYRENECGASDCVEQYCDKVEDNAPKNGFRPHVVRQWRQPPALAVVSCRLLAVAAKAGQK